MVLFIGFLGFHSNLGISNKLSILQLGLLIIQSKKNSTELFYVWSIRLI